MQVVSCCVCQYLGLHKNLSDLSLVVRSGDIIFCSATLGFSRRHIFKLMVTGYGRPMQLLSGEVDWFQGLAVMCISRVGCICVNVVKS